MCSSTVVPSTVVPKTPTQVFSREYFEIRKNTYFEKHLRTTASAKQFRSQLNDVYFSTIGFLDTAYKFRQKIYSYKN